MTPKQLIKKINFPALASMFNEGKGWSMRSYQNHALAMVNDEGTWVLPPVACKSYLDDTIGAHLTGKKGYGAYGYVLPVADLVDHDLYLIAAVDVADKNDFFLPTLKNGAETFDKLTGGMFKKAKFTSLGNKKFSWYWKGSSGDLRKFVGYLITYDQRINLSPMMHSLFIACLRGSPVDSSLVLCTRDASTVSSLLKKRSYNDFSRSATTALKFLCKNHPNTKERAKEICETLFPVAIHSSGGFRDFAFALSYGTYKTRLEKLNVKA
jgi:hypothetical protein